MTHESPRLALLLLLAAPMPAATAQEPQLAELSLRAPVEPLVDQTGNFVLSLEIDPLAGETLVSEQFTIELRSTPGDALFADSFESP